MSPSYIGIDAHVKSCQCCVINGKGEEKLNVEVKTEPRILIEFIRSIRGPRYAITEMSSMAEWLVRTLSSHVETIVVCDARKNRWTWASDDSTDVKDAHNLAQALRGEFYTPVYVPTEDRQRFKETAQDYHRMTKDIVRTKNRIKAKYRSQGLRHATDKVYAESTRSQFIALIEPESRRTTLEAHYRVLDAFESEKKRLVQRLRSMSKRHHTIKLLQTVPGVGFINAMTFFALVDTPYRFPSKEHLWSYARLGLKDKTSAGKRKGGGQKGGCRQLKSALMIAARAAVYQCKTNREFAIAYQELLNRGISERVAMRTIARRICSILYGIWKSQEPYRGPKKSGT